MTTFSSYASLAGGALIGLAASLLLIGQGRIGCMKRSTQQWLTAFGSGLLFGLGLLLGGMNS